MSTLDAPIASPQAEQTSQLADAPQEEPAATDRITLLERQLVLLQAQNEQILAALSIGQLTAPRTPAAARTGEGAEEPTPSPKKSNVLFAEHGETVWKSGAPLDPETPRVRLIDTINPDNKVDACDKFNIPVPSCANIRVNRVTGDAWIEMGGKPLPDLTALARNQEAVYRPLANIPMKLSDQTAARKLRITPPTIIKGVLDRNLKIGLPRLRIELKKHLRDTGWDTMFYGYNVQDEFIYVLDEDSYYTLHDARADAKREKDLRCFFFSLPSPLTTTRLLPHVMISKSPRRCC